MQTRWIPCSSTGHCKSLAGRASLSLREMGTATKAYVLIPPYVVKTLGNVWKGAPCEFILLASSFRRVESMCHFREVQRRQRKDTDNEWGCPILFRRTLNGRRPQVSSHSDKNGDRARCTSGCRGRASGARAWSRSASEARDHLDYEDELRSLP